MWFNLVWDDYQLSWNESQYGGVDSVVIQPRNLWIPDILLYNRSVMKDVIVVLREFSFSPKYKPIVRK